MLSYGQRDEDKRAMSRFTHTSNSVTQINRQLEIDKVNVNSDAPKKTTLVMIHDIFA